MDGLMLHAGATLVGRQELLWNGSSALRLDLAEELLLPFEWAQEGDWYWRVFRVPAAVLHTLTAITRRTASTMAGGDKAR